MPPAPWPLQQKISLNLSLFFQLIALWAPQTSGVFFFVQGTNHKESRDTSDAVQGKVRRSIEAQDRHRISNQTKERFDSPGSAINFMGQGWWVTRSYGTTHNGKPTGPMKFGTWKLIYADPLRDGGWWWMVECPWCPSETYRFWKNGKIVQWRLKDLTWGQKNSWSISLGTTFK